jgi:hypothetical protein
VSGDVRSHSPPCETEKEAQNRCQSAADQALEQAPENREKREKQAAVIEEKVRILEETKEWNSLKEKECDR